MVISCVEEALHAREKAESLKMAATLAHGHFDRIFSEVPSIYSFHQFKAYRNRFDNPLFKEDHPELADCVDDVCLSLRKKVSLALHGEKIRNIAGLLRGRNVRSWSPRWVKDNLANEYGWIVKNIRTPDGKIDWDTVRALVTERYPSRFSYQESRPDLDKASALSMAREILRKIVLRNGHWHPTDLELDENDGDKAVYGFLTMLPEYRRKADRPDIGHARDDRPNWHAIAQGLGPEFQKNMVIGRNGHENDYRDLPEAIDQLHELVMAGSVANAAELARTDAALYAWFKNHCRDEYGEVDWKTIVASLPEEAKARFRAGI